MTDGKRILVAALNWGLGHASRCVPIIKILKDLGYEVIIASDGQALELLKSNFPDLRYIELPELKVRYSSRGGAVVSILTQIPKLSSYIRKEKKAIQEYLKEHPIDLIISDNRYGIYDENIPSVIITHQLKVKVPMAAALSAELIKARLKYFDECWVPDDDQHSLSAELSANSLPIPKISIGSLSQFSGINLDQKLENKEELLVILSGPEPARSKFEEKLIKQAELFEIPILIVKGVKDIPSSFNSNFVRIESQLNAHELLNLINSHDQIVCRSGYSSIMDLSCLKKKALLVPTPGQAEQIYLATYHRDRQNFYSVKEQDLDLSKDLNKAFDGTYQPKKSCLEYNKQKELIGERLERLMLRKLV